MPEPTAEKNDAGQAVYFNDGGIVLVQADVRPRITAGIKAGHCAGEIFRRH